MGKVLAENLAKRLKSIGVWTTRSPILRIIGYESNILSIGKVA